MNARITKDDLAGVAGRIAVYARSLNLIEPWQTVRVGSAYGGTRLEVSGDPELLTEQFGSDRANWPAGWSGVSFPIFPESGFSSRRETWELARGTSYALAAVLRKRDERG